MELIGNETQELESNLIDNDKMDCERLDTEEEAQREAAGAQTIENKIKKTGPYSEDVGAEKEEPGLMNVKVMSAFENSEVASQKGLTNLENISTLPDVGSVYPGDGKIEPLHVDETHDSGHLNNEDKGSSGLSGKRKAKPKGPVTTSWSLRSKSGEKPPKAPVPDDIVKEATVTGEKKMIRKKKQQKQNTVSEYAKTKTHLKYLLNRIKYEQNLIDAYSTEGWKGQSLEKLKPEKELQQARSRILHYKMRIRELFQRLELSLSVGKIPESLFDSLGEIDCEDIFCAKCGSKDLTLDNDIILCDGACERGFHQFCLEPPLLKEHIPPGDEGWLCPACDCKVDCIDMLKDYQGTKVSITDSWEKIFPEAAAANASGMKLDGASGSLSDESEDDDYDPDKHDTDIKVEGDQSSSDDSDYFSAPDDSAAPLNNNDKFLGLPSDDSEDDDFDPSAAPDQDEDERVNQDGSSSDFTSDSEDLDALLKDDNGHGEDVVQIPSPTESKEENSTVSKRKGQSLKAELSYLMETSAEPVSGKRHVERMDYKKLHDETFGNSSSDSSDEDFDDTSGNDDTSSCDDTTSRKRRKIDRGKTQAKLPGGETTIVESNMNTNDENQKENKHLPRRTRRKRADGGPSRSSAKVHSSASSGARKCQRLGEATTQKLYASFNVNRYPDKAAKEKLAKELGITIQQVAKWFENARWSFNHRPRMESNSTVKQTKLEQSSGIPSEAIDESSAAITNSGELNGNDKLDQSPKN